MRLCRFLLALTICGVPSVGIATAAQASQSDKVVICHGTASETNPYVVISVDESALAGHFDGTAPGHGESNHPDMLLPAGGTVDDCGSGEEGGEE